MCVDLYERSHTIKMKTIKMILTNGFYPDVRVYKEALYLNNHGCNVEILCWERNCNSKLPLNEIVDGIEITRFKIPSTPGTGKKQIPAFMKYIKCVSKYLNGTDYDFIHCNDLDGRIVAILARVKNKKCIFDMHEFYENGNGIRRKLIRIITLYFIKRSKASLYENDVYLSKPYGKYKNRLYSLKNYPDNNMIKPLPKTKSNVFRIGYHGALRSQIPHFRALFEAVKGNKDIRVDINGAGIDYSGLLELSKAYENVHVNGPYNGAKESSKLYANTDVLFCGYDKNVPNHQKDAEAVKFFEAIITGTPMIMQEGIGMGDKVTDRGYGISIDTKNSEAIKHAIDCFINDREFYLRCRNNEQNDAYKYRWEKEVESLSVVYELK